MKAFMAKPQAFDYFKYAEIQDNLLLKSLNPNFLILL